MPEFRAVRYERGIKSQILLLSALQGRESLIVEEVSHCIFVGEPNYRRVGKCAELCLFTPEFPVMTAEKFSHRVSRVANQGSPIEVDDIAAQIFGQIANPGVIELAMIFGEAEFGFAHAFTSRSQT